MITIDLTGDSCEPGRYITQFRTNKLDKDMITEAAGMVGMTLAEFVRTVAYQAAIQVHQGSELADQLARKYGQLRPGC